MRGSSINEAWYAAVYNCYRLPDSCPTPRGQRTRERVAELQRIDLAWPVLTLAERQLGYRFLCAEAAWMLSGDDRVETIAPYSKQISYFSDDGERFFGAYGPKILAQLPYVLDRLRRDRDSRQAVLNIWRESPPETKDPPCTLGCQFLVREKRLHLFVNMRSSDVWLGLPYDVFNFAMLAGCVLLELGDPQLKLGTLYQYAASRHLYQHDWDAADRLLSQVPLPPATLFTPPPFDPLDQFRSAGDLVEHLWALARRDRSNVRSTWLTELLDLSTKEVVT